MFLPVLFTALLPGCDNGDPDPIVVSFTSGKETDAFTDSSLPDAPAPKTLRLHTVSLDGTSSQVLETGWPSGTVSLDIALNQQVAFETFGRSAQGAILLRGASIYHALWLQNDDPIPLFLGRVGLLSRPPGTLPLSHVGGFAAAMDGRFLVSVGGVDALSEDGTTTDPARFVAYDLGLWQPSTISETLPRVPRSFAMMRGRWALIIDDHGADWFDFFTFASTKAVAPDGMDFSEVAGGRVLYGADGEAYVVGPSRREPPSSVVLRVDWDLTMTFARMDSERSGVASAYVQDRGLLLAGGHSSGPNMLM